MIQSTLYLLFPSAVQIEAEKNETKGTFMCVKVCFPAGLCKRRTES